MKNIFFYITAGMVFVLYRLIYYCYYGDMMGYLRVTESTPVLKILLLIWPLIIFIALIILSFKIGAKKCWIWDNKSKAILVILIIVIQIAPLGGLFDLVLPYGFTRKY